MNTALGNELLKEIEGEIRATRRCLEAIPPSLYDWKPHEKSMNMGYLALLVAEIPQWITWAIEKSEIDLGTYKPFPLSTNEALLRHFDRIVTDVKAALSKVTNEHLGKTFYLKNSGKVLIQQTIKECAVSSINHWVHHRGQLTVYMRLNDIPVPSIYGPSADERTF